MLRCVDRIGDSLFTPTLASVCFEGLTQQSYLTGNSADGLSLGTRLECGVFIGFSRSLPTTASQPYSYGGVRGSSEQGPVGLVLAI